MELNKAGTSENSSGALELVNGTRLGGKDVVTDVTERSSPCTQGGETHSEESVKGENCVSFEIDTNGEKAFSVVEGPAKAFGDSEESTRPGAVVKTSRPLCADYRSDSDPDSESDSSNSTDSSTNLSGESDDDKYENDGTCDSGSVTSETRRGNKKCNADLTLSDLPPIEDLKISVPEDACLEIGTITSIVDTLVVVESYKGTAALDVDTVLFLDSGKRTLGKVFDILGPVSEPVYAVRFNSPEQIKNNNVEKGSKVYCAPKTQHTSFIFLSEVLKNRGSDASWKDNIEAPSEFQDFSDDEEERRHRSQNGKPTSEGSLPALSRKRPFNKSSQVVRPSGFRNAEPLRPRRGAPQRFPSSPQFPPAPRVVHPAISVPAFRYDVPPRPDASVPGGFPLPARTFYPSRFSGPPFPTFGTPHYASAGFHFQQPFYQQRAHGFQNVYGAWNGLAFRRPPPPPPPPASTGQD